jgi:hypothetical protein
MDADIKEAYLALLAEQTSAAKAITELAGLINRQSELADGRTARIEAAHLRLVEAQAETQRVLAEFITSGHERTKRLEENLDGLIRAITNEHSNGKKPKPE